MRPDYLKSPWKTLRFATAPYRGRLFVFWTFIAVANVVSNLLPYFFKIIADRVVGVKTVTAGDLTTPFVLIVLTLVLQEVLFRLAHVMEVYLATGIFRHITDALYQGLIQRPASYFENKFSGDLGRRIEQVSKAVMYFVEDFPWQMGWVFIALIVSAFLLYVANPLIFIVFICWFVVFIISSIPLLLWHRRASESVATTHAALSGSIIDALGNISLVHSFGGLKHERALNQGMISSVVGAEKKARWIHVWNKLQQGFSVVILGVGLMAASVLLFTRGQFTVGDFVIVAATIPSLIGVVWNFGDSVLHVSRNFGELSNAAARLYKQHDSLKNGVIDRVEAEAGTIDFSNIFFQYPSMDQEVFKNFSLHIQRGQHVGVVGKSGGGKSTLIKMLLRHHEPQAGTISIGGTPTDQLTSEAFNKLISYVPQDTSLFHRTLLENIRYAKPEATEEEVLEASKRAHAHEFIMTLPQEYATKVGERGVKLSGGQRQRVALARAILKNAPILVLDEATSSLDSESETVIQEALSDLFQDRTVIAIAHRLSTLRAMDWIVVVEDGAIVETGTPQELLDEKDSLFKRMWEHQKHGFI